MNRVPVKPVLLRWALERADRSIENMAQQFPMIDLWMRGELAPTFKQLEKFANAVHAPIGFFFLPEPPVERIPIPDFRTMHGSRVPRRSPELLDTIYMCQQRQEWYREFALLTDEGPREFVGAANLTGDIKAIAGEMRHALKFDIEERRRIPTWTDALRLFIEQADALGVLVMVSGVVGNNNRRKLDPQEFRGFALADILAPLVFINGADSKAAQMFTLAHELAHLWLGQSALSDLNPEFPPLHEVESWCKRVAAELLVPLDVIQSEYRRDADISEEMNRLARRFKVSTLVILRRLHDFHALDRDEFRQFYEREIERLQSISRPGGGDFYLTQAARIGKRFVRALVMSTLEGHTLHRDAFRMLGVSKLATFHELGHSVGVL